MAEQRVLGVADLPKGAKKTVRIGDTEILLLNLDGTVVGVEAKCPHAGAPLEQGAVCNGRLVCPWHMGTFSLPGGSLIEPPPMRPLKTYAVRIDGEDILCSADPILLPHVENEADKRTFLLVGAGAASTMAAVTLRLEGFSGKIIAVDPEHDEPVDRTQLSKQALAGKMPIQKTQLDQLTEAGAERLVSKVVKLSAATKQVTLADGDTLSFDAALLATGGTPKRLDVPGAGRAFTLRHTGDVASILEAAQHGTNVVIVGASFIALEAASALTQKGLHVTVVGTDELPFAKKFGEPVARAIKALHESKGTRFLLGGEVSSITPTDVLIRYSKASTGVATLPANIVLFGVGVTPALDFDHDLPLAEKGGIAVSNDLRAADGVWVAGDIANVDGTRIEHWRLAEQHGQVAAKQMLGDAARYDGVPFFWTFHYGKRLGYLGHANDWDEIHYDGSIEELTFLAYYVKQGKVAAILSCGRDTDTSMLAEVMRSKPTLEEVREAVRK